MEKAELCTWKNTFESLLVDHGLTFGPGNASKCVIGFSRINIDKTSNTHLCFDLDWSSNQGYGNLFVANPKDIKKYLDFVILLSRKSQNMDL